MRQTVPGIDVVVAMTFLGGFVVLQIVPSQISTTRPAAFTSQCNNNLRQVAGAGMGCNQRRYGIVSESGFYFQGKESHREAGESIFFRTAMIQHILNTKSRNLGIPSEICD